MVKWDKTFSTYQWKLKGIFHLFFIENIQPNFIRKRCHRIFFKLRSLQYLHVANQGSFLKFRSRFRENRLYVNSMPPSLRCYGNTDVGQTYCFGTFHQCLVNG